MFTYVKTKNFKSLKDIEINFNKTKAKTNRFIAIYGENGSGKTNIVELFKFLQESVMARGKDIAMITLPKEIIELHNGSINVRNDDEYIEFNIQLSY